METLEASKLHKLVYKKGDFELHLEKGSAPVVVAPLPVAEVASTPPPKSPALSGTFVTSPMVGTFYGSPSPDQPPFVKVGDRVEPGTVVCIIEAMKVMNEVKAGVRGTVAEVLGHSGQPVEFASRLFRVT